LNRERKVLLAAGAAGAVAASLHVPLCPVALLLHVPCPGCGLSRAAFALLRGDTHAAFAAHPLVFVALPAAVGLALHATSRGPVSPSRERAAIAFSAMLLAMLLAVWLARFAGALGGPVTV
jgi:hypothetical protein